MIKTRHNNMTNKKNSQQIELTETLNNFQKKLKDIERQTLKRIAEVIKRSDVQKADKIIKDIKKII